MMRILIKLLTAICASVLVSIFITATYFSHDGFLLMVCFGALILFVVYGFIGIPLSMLIDLCIRRLELKSSLIRVITSVCLYGIGGILGTIIFYLLSERESLVRLFQSGMLFYYKIGLISSISFYIIESLLKRLNLGIRNRNMNL